MSILHGFIQHVGSRALICKYPIDKPKRTAPDTGLITSAISNLTKNALFLDTILYRSMRGKTLGCFYKCKIHCFRAKWARVPYR